ncbi:leukocyte elastase inhibitor-like [Ctenopharyngodon idella]|uniref:leukocyte elastase inhibitor-like n=1 Tax=Ctenopharyngodon idella TaxID=7959 RepID=UPI00222FC10B|nr:leukocyte elastase inhibitor-like [Ctenopharyngodon idella]XP_051731591.1 leukocyte elastase inhibitor-like [Ctenopharyngodon idella]XP_051731592.1 leukocyte elastase inhibitor-like [Ctenopharyngodon idella]XP_051731593.1 leukocyte elastase inhibitor-like [Ctenopharyngodon idella]
MEGLARANSLFALDLYRALSASSSEGNMFFSPLSISAALSMVYLGARGDTAEEMAKVLSFSSVSDVHSHFESLTSSINGPSASYILRLANRLYGEKTFSFLPEYLDSTLKLYHADLQAVDFIGASEDSRQLINKWVEEQTENKIQNLLKPGTVTGMTRLVLVNAIYFKGNWLHIFEARRTEEMPFKINQNESRPVEMMYQKKKFLFRCIPEYKLQVLELPYKQELSMLILLPNETQDGSDPLLKLESELTLDKLLDWTNTDEMTTWMDIRVHLPKFKLEVESSLSKILQEMGMSSVFQETKADLAGMSSQDGLFISAVVHKAFVEVNEEGTEAAAATGFILGSCASKQDPQNFTADHPFIFFIRHNPTNSILFLGRFRGPF